MKYPDRNQDSNRREFLRGSVRNALLLLIALATALVARSRRPQPGQPCVNRGICGACAVFARCELPRAQSVKRTQQGG